MSSECSNTCRRRRGYFHFWPERGPPKRKASTNTLCKIFLAGWMPSNISFGPSGKCANRWHKTHSTRRCVAHSERQWRVVLGRHRGKISFRQVVRSGGGRPGGRGRVFGWCTIVRKEEETDEEAEEKVSSECTDQLVREWIALVDEATNWNAKPILIYLTADFGCPREQIRASLDEHRKKRPNAMEPLICWLSWRELADLFDKAADYPILLAIARMAEKVGLTFFRSITKVAPICVTWRFKAPPQQWRFQVPPIIFQWSFQTSYVRTLPQTWQFRVEPIISLWRFRQTTSEWSFRVSRIVCQWRFQESAAAWYFDAAPIVLRWRFKR